MKYKRNLIIVLIASIIYIVLTLIYNNIIIKANEKVIFLAKEDIPRGCKISIENLQTLTIKEEDFSSEYITDISTLGNMILNFDIFKGQIITNEMLISDDNYIEVNQGEEIVSVKVKSAEDSSSYKISKDSIVNIYYTGKSDYANDILKYLNTANVISGGDPAYITAEILNSIKIINVYDKYGNEINGKNTQDNSESLIDTVIISTNSEMAMVIYNLSRYGDFSISTLN